jgi:hypothetical protein
MSLKTGGCFWREGQLAQLPRRLGFELCVSSSSSTEWVVPSGAWSGRTQSTEISLPGECSCGGRPEGVSHQDHGGPSHKSTLYWLHSSVRHEQEAI